MAQYFNEGVFEAYIKEDAFAERFGTIIRVWLLESSKTHLASNMDPAKIDEKKQKYAAAQNRTVKELLKLNRDYKVDGEEFFMKYVQDLKTPNVREAIIDEAIDLAIAFNHDIQSVRKFA